MTFRTHSCPPRKKRSSWYKSVIHCMYLWRQSYHTNTHTPQLFICSFHTSLLSNCMLFFKITKLHFFLSAPGTGSWKGHCFINETYLFYSLIALHSIFRIYPHCLYFPKHCRYLDIQAFITREKFQVSSLLLQGFYVVNGLYTSLVLLWELSEFWPLFGCMHLHMHRSDYQLMGHFLVNFRL